MEQDSHITVRGLTHFYGVDGTALTALAGVDFEARRGEFVSVIGPSGGGKTTLLKVIGGLLQPTSGTVAIDGASPEDAQLLKRIGFVFQESALLPWKTVTQNVRLPMEINHGETPPDIGATGRLIETVGLDEFRDYYSHQLSGGMRQRVAFARALVTDPDVLLMDEPLGSLDEITRTSMRYELLKIWEALPKTIVLVTHSIAEAVMMSDRVVVLSSRPGRVVGEISIDLPRPREEALERAPEFLDRADGVRELLAIGAKRTTTVGGARAGS
ncbi:MAG: ABC transporter ATP-binding protein [SAR202 cluster bacterium]|nr:ABC transporter ATP-binding protein [SAR202 cluster bacterium]